MKEKRYHPFHSAKKNNTIQTVHRKKKQQKRNEEKKKFNAKLNLLTKEMRMH